MKQIGIFRALDVRYTHAEFAASFRQLKPFFAANMQHEMRSFLNSNNIAYIDMQLKPTFLKDPMYPVLRKTDFTPWMSFDKEALNSVVENIDYYEIYEPYFFYSTQIADMAHKKDKPLLTEIWTSFSKHPSKYIPPYNLVVQNVLHKTDLFILRSEKALSFLDGYTIPEEKKCVIYHGINLKRFHPLPKNHDRIRILFVGALAAHKGLDDLLAVFERLAEKYPNKIQLIICGNGPLQNNINKLSLSLPIDFRGWVSNTKLHEIYQSCDIYCQPSKDFSFLGIKGGEEFAGYTFMEAMACGLPIVSTYCGGIPEIVGDENTLIKQKDRSALFSSLEKYILNASLRAETGNKNRKRAEMFFDILKQTKKLETAILEKL